MLSTVSHLDLLDVLGLMVSVGLTGKKEEKMGLMNMVM
jgi:hypothetical protein